MPASNISHLLCSHSRVRQFPQRTAFTLIELLTVIAIIGILAAIIIPTVGVVRKAAQRAACASNLRQISIATIAYATDNKDWLPGDEKGGQGWYGLNSSAGPKGWFEAGMPTGDLVAWIYGYLGVQRNGDTVFSSLFVCPGNAGVKAHQNDSVPAAAYFIGATATLKISSKVRPIGFDGKRSVRLTDIENPRRAPFLFDQDVQMTSLGMKNYKGGVISLTSNGINAEAPVHGSTRNVVYYDGHVQAVDKNIDPHEK